MPKEIINAFLPENQIVAAHYVRFTVDDKPLVLAQLSQAIADQNINICEVKQPEVKGTVSDPLTGLTREIPQEELGPAELAFLLDPCDVERVRKAVLEINKLPACLAVNTVYKVLGNPTHDISRRYQTN